MKLLILVVLGAVLTVSGVPSKASSFFGNTWQNLYRGPPVPDIPARALYNTKWIEQKLDNFNNSESRTWEMRYMVNDKYFVEGGPMFIYVGGEWTINAGSILSGHFVDMAKEHNGILFYTEHRFYGQSRPLEDITVDSLKYLHVKQALADLAHFIQYQRMSNSSLADSKVIMAGGSYAATMVVWFKRLYPDLLNGGWASSAPLQAKVNFREYKEVVGKAILELGGKECYDTVEQGMTDLEEMVNDYHKSAELKAMLQLCNSFDEHNDLDVWSLFGGISNIFAGIVQYQKEGDVPRICDYLMSFGNEAVAIASLALSRWGYDECVDATYKSTLEFYHETSYKFGASRPWYYQTCNEYGWYQSSSSPNQPFGTKFPATLYITLCGDVFGPRYTNETLHLNADRTNRDFGGMLPNVKDVYMTHGALDPWNPMGHGEPEGATVISRASHCADFGSISSRDSQEMRESKERIAELVREWLAE